MKYRFNGNLLREFREARGMPQRQLAVLLGVTQPYLCGLENGRRLDLFSSRLAYIAEFLGVEMSDLMVREADE